jgi:uncharacterized damage-inducible protein DinB
MRASSTAIIASAIQRRNQRSVRMQAHAVGTGFLLHARFWKITRNLEAEMLFRLRISLLLLAALIAIPVFTQEKKASPPKPAPEMVGEVLATWQEAGRKVIAMAEDFPEAKYDFKPSKDVRSFAEQLRHVAVSNKWFLHVSRGERFREDDDATLAKNHPTRAAVIAYLKKPFADVGAHVKSLGDAGMQRTLKHPFESRMMTQWAFWMRFVGHAGEHYGQLVVYYRVNGLVPPESRQ